MHAGESRVVNKQQRRLDSGHYSFTRRRLYHHLSQEVVLRVLVQRRNCAPGPEPRVYSNILLISLAKAAIIREADVFF